jgi:hypothetical protein
MRVLIFTLKQGEVLTNEKKKKKQTIRFLKTSQESTQGRKEFQEPIQERPPGDNPIWKNQIPYEIPVCDPHCFESLSRIDQNLSRTLKKYQRPRWKIFFSS